MAWSWKAFFVFAMTFFSSVLLSHALQADPTAVVKPLPTGAPVNPSLFGLNDVLGPVMQIPYDHQVLLDVVESLRVGILRHPGGTVANYWNISSGRYASTCSHSSTCEEFGPAVDKFPLGTFSPQNFVEHLTKFTGAGLPVFDLNILTMNESSFASQVDQLKPYCVDNRCLVELGNEIYLNPYRWRFLTADSYMEACEPLVTLLRKEFPNVVISVAAGGIGSFLPSSYLSWLNEDSRKIVEDRKDFEVSWQAALAKHRNLFDAVSIHDYASDRDLQEKFSNATSTTVVATWPEMAYAKVVEESRRLFNESIIILITEYNQGLSPKEKSFAEDHRNGGVHALNALSHIMAGVSHGRVIQAMQYHAMLSVEGVGWDQQSGIVHLPGENATSAFVNGASQLFAHTSTIANMHSEMFGTSVEGGLRIDEDFPVKNMRGMSCLQAVWFAKNSTGTLAVTNRCDQHVPAQLDLNDFYQDEPPRLRSVSMVTYNCSPALLGDWVPMPAKDAAFPWPGPVPSTQSSIVDNDNQYSVSLPPFTYSLISM